MKYAEEVDPPSELCPVCERTGTLVEKPVLERHLRGVFFVCAACDALVLFPHEMLTKWAAKNPVRSWELPPNPEAEDEC